GGHVLTFIPPGDYFESRAVSATTEALADDGQRLGPIVRIQITGQESYFDDITVLVLGNSPPSARDDQIMVDPTNGPARIDVLLNDLDSNGNALSIAAVGAAQHGMTANGIDHLDYTPAVGFSGVDSFSYTVSDGRGGSSTATVTVTVNAPPIAGPDRYEL